MKYRSNELSDYLIIDEKEACESLPGRSHGLQIMRIRMTGPWKGREKKFANRRSAYFHSKVVLVKSIMVPCMSLTAIIEFIQAYFSDSVMKV